VFKWVYSSAKKTEQLRSEWKVLLFLSIWIALYAPSWFSPPEADPCLSQSRQLPIPYYTATIFVPVLIGETAFCTRLLDQRPFKSVASRYIPAGGVIWVWAG